MPQKEKDNEEKACSNPPPKSSTYTNKKTGKPGVKLTLPRQSVERRRRAGWSPRKTTRAKCCEPNNTGDHLIEVNCFTPVGGRKKKDTFPEFAGHN